MRNKLFCAANSLGGVRWSRSPSWILGLWFGFFNFFLFASSLDRASAHFLSEKFFYATNCLGAISQNNSSYIDIYRFTLLNGGQIRVPQFIIGENHYMGGLGPAISTAAIVYFSSIPDASQGSSSSQNLLCAMNLDCGQTVEKI